LKRFGESVIAILDPDFIFLKPLTQSGEALEDIIYSQGNRKKWAGMDLVKKGRPVAQRYGIGGGWVRRFPVKDIAGAGSHALTYTTSTAATHFAVGPPMMIHIDDALPLSALWAQYMRPVLKKETDILADMWAYSIASAHLKLEHTIVDHHMVSTWNGGGEGFPFIDAWNTMSCRNPANDVSASQKLPTFIHMASNFKAPANEQWMFHKGHVPADLLHCGTPLIKESPDDLWSVVPKSDSHHKRSAWILCNIVSRINKQTVMYKERFCPGGKFENQKIVRLIQMKTRDRGCNWKQTKWCWPLAQIESKTPVDAQTMSYTDPPYQ
jgi:hypothetical protein